MALPRYHRKHMVLSVEVNDDLCHYDQNKWFVIKTNHLQKDKLNVCNGSFWFGFYLQCVILNIWKITMKCKIYFCYNFALLSPTLTTSYNSQTHSSVRSHLNNHHKIFQWCPTTMTIFILKIMEISFIWTCLMWGTPGQRNQHLREILFRAH